MLIYYARTKKETSEEMLDDIEKVVLCQGKNCDTRSETPAD